MAAEMVKAAMSGKLKEMDWEKKIKICELVEQDPGAYARKKGRNNVTLDDLIHVITLKGRYALCIAPLLIQGTAAAASGREVLQPRHRPRPRVLRLQQLPASTSCDFRGGNVASLRSYLHIIGTHDGLGHNPEQQDAELLFGPGCTGLADLGNRYFEKQSLKAAFASALADPTVDLNMQIDGNGGGLARDGGGAAAGERNQREKVPQDSEGFRQPDMHHGMEVRLGLSKGPICPSFS
ncbi:hypothetical protein ZEAMMB73_Zm00001d042228 [Zea mays]|uniref:Uncharacterized protein n=1 Tax=Zea mays TaxID=4577 RepID=A0A1D6N293_MAIZE|nr:hypothetical protein ZEAMMB73_Zm00001d042228 [Zea mays]